MAYGMVLDFQRRKARERNIRIFLMLSAAIVVLFGGIVAMVMPSASHDNQTMVVVKDVPPPQMSLVVIPTTNIAAGSQLNPELFRTEARPSVGLSDRYLRGMEEIHGQYAKFGLAAGEPISRDFLTNVRPVNFITANIPAGYRAVSINVNALTGVEGFARAGAKVDVIWHSQIRGESSITKIIENVLVLSAERQTSQNTDPGAPTPSTITLLVTEADANKVHLAVAAGRLSLALRGDEDRGRGGEVRSLTTSDLLQNGGRRAGTRVDGVVTMRGENGETSKYALIGGKLVKNDAQAKANQG